MAVPGSDVGVGGEKCGVSGGNGNGGGGGGDGEGGGGGDGGSGGDGGGGGGGGGGRDGGGGGGPNHIGSTGGDDGGSSVHAAHRSIATRGTALSATRARRMDARLWCASAAGCCCSSIYDGSRNQDNRSSLHLADSTSPEWRCIFVSAGGCFVGVAASVLHTDPPLLVSHAGTRGRASHNITHSLKSLPTKLYCPKHRKTICCGPSALCMHGTRNTCRALSAATPRPRARPRLSLRLVTDGHRQRPAAPPPPPPRPRRPRHRVRPATPPPSAAFAPRTRGP